MKVSKNLKRGELVTSLPDLMKLAEEKQSVCFLMGGWHDKKLKVRPAAFLVNWPLCRLVGMTIFKTERV